MAKLFMYQIMMLRLSIVAILVLISGASFSQRIVLLSGNLDCLIGQSEILLKYDYEELAVGKYDNESDFLVEMVTEKNEDKSGTGDEWREEWFVNRIEKFHPAFESALNKKVKKRGVTIGDMYQGAKYTLIMKMVKIEPGYVYFSSEESPSISLSFEFFESNNLGNELAEIAIPLCRGPYGSRLEDKLKLAYTRCGTALGEYLIEEVFKK